MNVTSEASAQTDQWGTADGALTQRPGAQYGCAIARYFRSFGRPMPPATPKYNSPSRWQ